VLLVFAHAQQGAPLAIRLLHGFFPAMRSRWCRSVRGSHCGSRCSRNS